MNYTAVCLHVNASESERAANNQFLTVGGCGDDLSIVQHPRSDRPALEVGDVVDFGGFSLRVTAHPMRSAREYGTVLEFAAAREDDEEYTCNERARTLHRGPQ